MCVKLINLKLKSSTSRATVDEITYSPLLVAILIGVQAYKLHNTFVRAGHWPGIPHAVQIWSNVRASGRALLALP